MSSFFSFRHDRPKASKRYHGGPRPHPSNGYGYHHGAASTVTLHRPPPPPIAPAVYQPPPQQAWGSPPQRPVHMASHSTLHVPGTMPGSPPGYQPVYGAPQSPPWAAPVPVANPVYPSSGHRPKKSKSSLNLSALGFENAAASVNNLVHAWDEVMDTSNGLYDRMSVKLDRVITCMDEEQFSGNETDLELHEAPTKNSSRNNGSKQSLVSSSKSSAKANHFSKVWEYSNSRLPPYLPPIKLYLDTWPLLNLAARYSLSVYAKPTGREKNDHVKGNRLLGTKAMTLKSLPLDDKNTIVFAIRGTSTFMDWTVNMRQEPLSPEGFLDNADNYVHAGFLQVAQAMVRPVAERLRTLLQEDPSRGLASLLITGHSAGGAVAQLLYAHMVSEVTQSELTHLVGFFKRVHCVTFGAPPVSLFPLSPPQTKRMRKSMFYAFANEGDPVVRADKSIVRSLLKLYAVPAPSDPCKVICPIVNSIAPGFVPPRIKKMKSSKRLAQHAQQDGEVMVYPAWKIPESLLSLGGRIMLLRPRFGGVGPEDLEMCGVSDEMLREVVYGDPMAHAMKLYARRIEILATRAATGQGG